MLSKAETVSCAMVEDLDRMYLVGGVEVPARE